MTHLHDDELTPRHCGLLIGNDWAKFCRKRGLVLGDDDGNYIDPVAAAALDTPQIPEGLRQRIIEDAGMGELLDASQDPDAESAFWGGFRDGVRAYIVQVRDGATDN